MTYHARKPRPSAMGDALSAIGNAVSAIAGIANDPFSGELTCRVRQIVALGTKTNVACTSTPLRAPSPARLKAPVVAMRAYVYAEKNPWAYPVAAAAVVGVPFLLGYLVGRK